MLDLAPGSLPSKSTKSGASAMLSDPAAVDPL
jgi:hypothetical protein